MTWLLLTIFSWFIGYTWEDLTWKIQETYVIERYFDRIKEQEPLVYRNWRVLWQKCVWVTGCNYTNRTDCWGLMVWYMMQLDLIKSRRKNYEWDSFTYDWGGLNSFRLYTLWKPIKRSETKKGDFVYMEFKNWVRHFAVVCDTWATQIFDLYKKPYAECRKYPFPSKAMFATNGVVEFLNDKETILQETQEILLAIYQENEKQKTKVGFGIIDYLGYYVSLIDGIFLNESWLKKM